MTAGTLLEGQRHLLLVLRLRAGLGGDRPDRAVAAEELRGDGEEVTLTLTPTLTLT